MSECAGKAEGGAVKRVMSPAVLVRRTVFSGLEKSHPPKSSHIGTLLEYRYKGWWSTQKLSGTRGELLLLFLIKFI